MRSTAGEETAHGNKKAPLIERLWRNGKRWRKVSVGPVSLFYRLGRNVARTNTMSVVSALTSAASATQVEVSSKPVVPSSREDPHHGETALIVGVGSGFGFAAARRFAASGLKVALASRRMERLQPLVDEIRSTGHVAHAYACDATDEIAVERLFAQVSRELGTPNLVVYSVQGFGPGSVLDVEVAAFEESWRQNCLGGFIVAREACRMMLPQGCGSIVLVGSTSSLLGREGHVNLAVGKFGLRAIAQVLAREVWSSGIHVAHMIIDADIKDAEARESRNEVQAEPEHLANAILDLHRQPRTAWTSEIDFRPWNERFWEHC